MTVFNGKVAGCSARALTLGSIKPSMGVAEFLNFDEVLLKEWLHEGRRSEVRGQTVA